MVFGLGGRKGGDGVDVSEERRVGSRALALASATANGASGNASGGGEDGIGPSPAKLLFKNPVALLHLVPQPAVLFCAGAMAGAIGKTLTAPLDRVKLLLQVQGGYSGAQVTAAAKSGNLLGAFAAIGREEGLLAYWKGNIPQVVRVLPYSAAQLYFYEFFKGRFHTDKEKDLPVSRRLAAGACAGMCSTLVTYPLDSIRLRLAVDPGIKGMGAATRVLLAEGGVAALYRGVGTSMLGIAPYLALELAAFDLIPNDKVPSFFRGFCAALLATSICYPMDTVRRQMQMQTRSSTLPLLETIKTQYTANGMQGFYRGFIPNALKNLPNKGIRLSVFDTAKNVMATSEDAYKAELEDFRRKHHSMGYMSAPLCGMNGITQGR